MSITNLEVSTSMEAEKIINLQRKLTSNFVTRKSRRIYAPNLNNTSIRKERINKSPAIKKRPLSPKIIDQLPIGELCGINKPKKSTIEVEKIVEENPEEDVSKDDAVIIPKLYSSEFMQSARKLKMPSTSGVDLVQAFRVIDCVTHVYDEASLINIHSCTINNEIKVEDETERKSNLGIYSSFVDKTKIFNNDQPALSLFTIPDPLWPLIGVQDNFFKKLRDLPAGPIGKLIIHKSGKLKLEIKNVRYTLTQEICSGGYKAMLLPSKENIAKNPSLIALGTITEKYTAVPDYFDLHEKFNEHD